jgi:hypothetical protein
VFARTVTSIILLTVLLAGILSPTAVCALMCDRHSRAEDHHHCNQDPDEMPGMAHNHSAMHHSVVGAITLVAERQSCKTGCATAEQLNISRKVVPQVTVVQTGAVVLDVTSQFLAPHFEDAWSLDSGPPSLSSCPSTASYSILRI